MALRPSGRSKPYSASFSCSKERMRWTEVASLLLMGALLHAFSCHFEQSVSVPMGYQQSYLLSQRQQQKKSSYNIPMTTATPCPKPIPEDDKLEFLSQSEEDKRLQQFFFGGGLCGGTYIEMGALDGRKFSNSFVFNQGYNWKGVLIEANPVTYKRLVQNRPNELALIHAAVCDSAKTVHWVEDPDRPQIGGILEFADPGFKEKWWTDEFIRNKQPIQCVPFGELLDQYSPVTYFDFFSLDVEGAEFLALKTLDFDRYAFGVVFVESCSDKRRDLMVRSLLEGQGYKFHAHYGRSDWYYHPYFGRIYQNFF